MRIEEVSVSHIQSLWQTVQPAAMAAAVLEDAAQPLARELYDRFKDSVVLSRMFITVPFAKLPDDNAQWVRGLASRASVEGELKAATPVLSLVGTYGDEADWCDRRKSRGHIGIPLVSSSFVSSIPMISRLLQELGVPMDWIDEGDTAIVKKKMGDLAGVFHVENAARTVDTQGRKIIPAQDFVRDHGIQSVFGVGGAYFGGSIVVLIVFCRTELERGVAERFLPLVNLFKSKTMSLVGPSKIFRA